MELYCKNPQVELPDNEKQPAYVSYYVQWHSGQIPIQFGSLFINQETKQSGIGGPFRYAYSTHTVCMEHAYDMPTVYHTVMPYGNIW